MKLGFKLTKREKYLLVVLFTAICGYLYFKFVYLPEGARYTALKAEYSQKLAVLDTVNKKQERMKQIEEKIGLLDAEVAQARDMLTLPLFVPDMLIDLHRQALKDNVQIDNITFTGAASPVKGNLTDVKSEKNQTNQSSDILGSVDSSINEILPSINSPAANQAGTASSATSGSTINKEIPEALKDLNISFSFTSSYPDLLRFIKYFEDGKRYALVELLDVDSSGAVLTGSMSVRMYTLSKESQE